MTKETRLVILTLLITAFICPQAFAAKSIQTAQRVIVIDPGHGGDDTGLTSPSGLYEKEITLKLAGKIRSSLESRYNVHLTRETDTALSAKERMAAANSLKADLLISIHLHNAGKEFAFIYFFDFQKELYPLAKIPDNAWSFSPLKFKAESRKAAKALSTYFSPPKNTLDLRTNILYGPIFPLEGSTMPAVLIEPFSISALPSHPARLEILLENLSTLLSQGIDFYFKNHPYQ